MNNKLVVPGSKKALENLKYEIAKELGIKVVLKDKKASLSDLTDSIIAWIRKENLSSNIMLSIKN